jgi:nucleoid-associated protein YgaU
MGLFDFVKGAGEKLFGKDTPPEEVAKTDPAKPTFDPAFTAKQLTQKVTKLGLPVTDLEISFAAGIATVRGAVPDRATAEKVVLQLGNTSIVEGVDDRLTIDAPEQAAVAAAPPAPPAVFHTVQKGDTLSKIAKSVYGDWKRYPEIFEANKPMLTDPDLIYPGQVLRIPDAPVANA